MHDEISAAMARHGAWLDNLKAAVAGQIVAEPLKLAGYDDMCDFGKWLYSLDDSVKVTPPFRRVKDRHYRFHQEAAEVVRLAIEGKYAIAAGYIDGPMTTASRNLIDALEAWQAAS